jgi:S-adenosylmethionine hydrolase
MPVGVQVAVVDPGVGTPRRPIAIQTTRGDVLIGPDNGLLLEPAQALGGAVEARELQNRDLWLPTTSSTFHGRDIFAPVTANLAAGKATFEDVGARVALDALVELARPPSTATEGGLEASVIYVDSFGNIRLGAALEDLEKAMGPMAPGTTVRVDLDRATSSAVVATTFGEVPPGTSLIYRDSSGHLAMADNQASAAARLEVLVGQRIRISRAT